MPLTLRPPHRHHGARTCRVGATLGTWLVLVMGVGGSARAAPTSCERAHGRHVLPAGVEQRIAALLGPRARAAPLPGGWRLRTTQIRTRSVRFRFTRQRRHFDLVLGWPHPDIPHRSAHFSLCLAAPADPLASGEGARLLRLLTGIVSAHDRGPTPWRELRDRGVPPPSAVPVVHRPPRAHLTLALQLLMGIGLLLVVLCGRPLRELARRVSGRDAGLLLATMAVGAAVRLLGGNRVPGWINGHGNRLMSEMLLFGERTAGTVDPHGNGYFALHFLFLRLFGRREATLLGVQLTLSVATIALTYALARLWLRDRAAAGWAALLVALYPSVAFFGLTEVRMVPGTFFVLLAFTLLGLAVRTGHPLLLLAAACWAVIATQCYATLMILPLPLALYVSSLPEGRRLLRSPWTWAAAAVGLVLYGYFTFRTLRSVAASGPHSELAREYLRPLDVFLVFVPRTSFAYETRGSVFLHSAFTPPTFVLAAMLPFAVRAVWRQHRGPLLAILGCALLLTVVNLENGGMNIPRLQQVAVPLYCLLGGLGLAWTVQRLAGALRGRAAVAGAIGVALVAGSVAIWPAQLGARFTPQAERRLFAQGAGRLPRGCTVVWLHRVGRYEAAQPAYLLARGRDLTFVELAEATIPAPVLRRRCVAYFRPAACFDRSHARDPAVRSRPLTGRIPACVAFERRYRLEPLFVRAIDARPDHRQVFDQRRLPVGFFRVTPPERSPR